jgi:chemotaxis protein methyltransferase CheR
VTIAIAPPFSNGRCRNCHITISRFFRDKGMFEVLHKRVLPDIGARLAGQRRAARIWSAGCACQAKNHTP